MSERTISGKTNPAAMPHASRNPTRAAWRLRGSPAAVIGAAGLALILLSVLLAPWVAPFDPVTLDYDHLLQPPGARHWMGTDDLGRDIFSRVLWGGRESLRVALLGTLISLTFGITLGVISGYWGGVLDSTIQRIAEVFLAFPAILLLLSVVAALGPGLPSILAAVAVAMIPVYTRVVRASVMEIGQRDFVVAAQLVGASHRRIMLRHVLPNVLPPIMVYATLGIGGIIVATAGLSYIGLGAQPPSPEWGAMLDAGRAYLRTAWWMSLFPGAAIFVTVLCVNLLGDGLREAIDPKARR